MAVRSLRALRSLRILRSPRTPPGLRARGSATVQANPEAKRLKSKDELAGPSLPTTMYWLFVKGYAEKSHLMQGLQKSLYGPIWRSRFGPFDVINVASSELIAQVIQQEGRYPVRAELPHWKEYRDLRGQAYGLHVETGPEWYRIRSALNPKMLKMKEVLAYAPVVNQVVGDLLQRIELLRSRSEDQATVSDLAAELYKFGFEGISSILFETRLGCLQEEIPKETLHFIAAVNNMLTLSDMVILFPRWTRSILPYWRRFVQAWDDLYNIAKNLIDRRMSDIEAKVRRGEPAEGMYLTYLLSTDKLSRAEVYISVTELLLGGVDTTSNTMSWTLYHLARDPRVQDRLYKEVNSVCPDRRVPTTDDLNQMPYLKAVIKEILRPKQGDDCLGCGTSLSPAGCILWCLETDDLSLRTRSSWTTTGSQRRLCSICVTTPCVTTRRSSPTLSASSRSAGCAWRTAAGERRPAPTSTTPTATSRLVWGCEPAWGSGWRSWRCT